MLGEVLERKMLATVRYFGYWGTSIVIIVAWITITITITMTTSFHKTFSKRSLLKVLNAAVLVVNKRTRCDLLFTAKSAVINTSRSYCIRKVQFMVR